MATAQAWTHQMWRLLEMPRVQPEFKHIKTQQRALQKE